MVRLAVYMDAAQTIRNAVSQVEQLREASLTDPALGAAVAAVKQLQSRRFAGTYSDLLAGGPYRHAARFFLEELYSDKDYAERDTQFSRIAGAIQQFFPRQVVATAVGLADLHALTEKLDFSMGVAWLSDAGGQAGEAARYVRSWRHVGRRVDRERQLSVVMGIGIEMARLTRTPGLRLMLKMMRGPAAASGLSSLQRFLEAGFDTFAAMSRMRDGAEGFLKTIEVRETALITQLFDGEFVASETHLASTLGSCPVNK